MAKRLEGTSKVDAYDAGPAASSSRVQSAARCIQRPSGVGGADTKTAEVLVALVRAAPDGQISAAQLCSRLYKKLPEAKDIIHKSKGIKGFIEGHQLECKVKFVADQVRWIAEVYFISHSPPGRMQTNRLLMATLSSRAAGES